MQSDAQIGEKIREMRKLRGLSQKELVGDKISRNMLSLIENGTASPSVSTLIYLAKRLGVPAGYFIPQNEAEEKTFARFMYIDQLRQEFASGNYPKCIELCGPEPEVDDESAFILASSHLYLACGYAENFEIGKALNELDAAIPFSEKSIYCGNSFREAARYYRLLWELICSDDIPPELCNTSGAGDYLSHETVSYFITLKTIREGESSAFDYTMVLKGAHRAHIEGLVASMDENYYEAIRKLKELSDSDIPSYMRFKVLSDLENAAESSGNMRLAYNASRKKLSLIEKHRLSMADYTKN